MRTLIALLVTSLSLVALPGATPVAQAAATSGPVRSAGVQARAKAKNKRPRPAKVKKAADKEKDKKAKNKDRGFEL